MVMLMFGKPEWFERRKYGGWGLTPKTKEGWVYVAAILLPLLLFQALPFWDAQVRSVALALWLAFVALDVFDIMLHMKKDERETMHEAFAERNAAWAMVLAATLGIIYQILTSSASKTPYVDPLLIIVLVAGLAAKAYTNWKLSKEN